MGETMRELVERKGLVQLDITRPFITLSWVIGREQGIIIRAERGIYEIPVEFILAHFHSSEQDVDVDVSPLPPNVF